MKKFSALLIALILLALTASTAFAKTTYDPEKPCFVIVAEDEKTGATYVTEVTYKTAAKRILAGLVYEVYMLEADALVACDFVVEEGKVIITSTVTGEVIPEPVKTTEK